MCTSEIAVTKATGAFHNVHILSYNKLLFSTYMQVVIGFYCRRSVITRRGNNIMFHNDDDHVRRTQLPRYRRSRVTDGRFLRLSGLKCVRR